MNGAATATLLDAALDYARRGWAVFPVHTIIDGHCGCALGVECGSPGKHPKITGGFLQASTVELTIRHWWTRWPDANVGIATGKVSGFFVLDVDPRHGGDDTLAELEKLHGPLPATVESLTGGGGRHILFRYPGYPVKTGTGTLGPGLDTRGDGGYIVGAPSLHARGRGYEWEASSHPDDVALADPPAWLLSLLTTEATNGNRRGFTVGEKIKDGARNDTLYRLARSLKARVMSPDAILAALLKENELKCEPPLPDAEIEKIVAHAYEQPDRPEYASGETEEDAQLGKEKKSLNDAMIDFKGLLAAQLPERPRYLPWLAASSSAMIFGPRGVGKTNFLLGLAAALTTGTPLLAWPVASPVGVLYVDGEMQLDELRSRAASLLLQPPRSALLFLTSELVYHKTGRDLVLTSDATRAEIMTILDDHPEIKVIVFDNVSALFSGLDEDRKRDWEPIASWLIRLRHRSLATVLVHHAGKSGQQRGTSGREDSLDVVIQLDRPAGYEAEEGCHFELRFTKCRSVRGKDVIPLDVKLEELKEQTGRLVWTYATLEETTLDQVKKLLAEGITSPAEIAEALGINRTWAWRLKKRVEQGKA